MVRGQFRGYRDEPGVAKDSTDRPPTRRCACTSTPGAGRACPFYIRAGKCLSMTATEVLVELKLPPQVVFAEPTPTVGNYVRFRLSPQVAIALGARAKRPGERMTGEPTRALGRGAAGGARALATYERLLGDAIAGDTTLFARQDVVEAAWAIVDPLIHRSGPNVRVRARLVGTAQADSSSPTSAAGTLRRRLTLWIAPAGERVTGPRYFADPTPIIQGSIRVTGSTCRAKYSPASNSPLSCDLVIADDADASPVAGT